MKSNLYLLAIASLLAVSSASSPLVAQAAGFPSSISYRGHLTDAGGLILSDNLPVEIRLYDSLMGGLGDTAANSHVIYAEKHPSVAMTGGNFELQIGSGTPLDPKWRGLPIDAIQKSADVYVELWVDGERLSPRQRFGSVMSVVRAGTAKYADEILNLPALTAAMIPSYDAGKITSGQFGGDQMPALDTSRISGVLRASNIPGLNTEKFSVNGTIPKERLQNISASKIKSGEVGLAQLPQTLLNRSDLVIQAGYLSRDQMLVFPQGFSPGQCSWALSLAQTIGSVEGIDRFDAHLNDSHVLQCLAYESPNIADPKETILCQAAYMLICKK